MDKGKVAVPWQSPKTYWACNAPIWPADIRPGQQTRPAGSGRRVLVLGDSLIHNVEQPLSASLLEQGWLPTVDCGGGKTTRWGYEQLRLLAARSHLPPRVVVSLGTNDGFIDRAGVAAFAQRVSKLMDILGPDRQVWWINYWVDLRKARLEGNPQLDAYPKYNEALASVLASHPNAKVIDWDQIVTASQSASGLATQRLGSWGLALIGLLRMSGVTHPLRC